MAVEVKVTSAFICDYAFIGENSKLSIIGIFQNINLSSPLPFIQPQLFVVANIVIKGAGNHEAEIRFVRSRDTKELVAPLKFALTTKDDREAGFAILGQLVSAQFDELGKYEAQIFVNNSKLTEVALQVGNP